MTYLVAAVALLGVLCLLNLLLTTGILRRMRAQGAHSPWPSEPPFALGPGASIGEFTAVTTAGDPVSHDVLTGLVGFVSAGCESCHDLLPELVEHARTLAGEDVLVVVAGDDREAVRALSPVARVVVADGDGGPVARAFQNTWTPALYLVADQRILATGARVGDLPDPPDPPDPPDRRASHGHAAGRG